MFPPKKILVPFDFSELSGAALKQAAGLCVRFGASLEVLHVLERTADQSIKKLLVLPEDIEKLLRHKIHAEVYPLFSDEERLQVKTEIVIAKGKPAVEILLRIEKDSPDWVVMGTHGRSGLKALLLGSVAEKVVRQSPVPVFIQRGPVKGLPQKILLPVDFSEAGQKGVEVGVQYAKEVGAEIYLLHVINFVDVYTFETLSMPVDRFAVEASIRKNAEQQLSKIADKLGIPVHQEVRLGHPVSEIEDAVRDHKIDWIVLATHGRTGLKRLALGSIAEGVVRHAPCSVLTLRPCKTQADQKVFEDQKNFDEYMKDCL